MLPVVLCDWKITTANPTLTIMFKIILRTFEAEILKIFKNIQPQLKNETFLYKKRECISIGKFQNQTKAVFAFSAH